MVNGLSLIGSILVSFGLPIGWQAYLSNVLWLQYLAAPFWILGLVLILIDLSNKEEWIEKLMLENHNE